MRLFFSRKDWEEEEEDEEGSMVEVPFWFVDGGFAVELFVFGQSVRGWKGSVFGSVVEGVEEVGEAGEAGEAAEVVGWGAAGAGFATGEAPAAREVVVAVGGGATVVRVVAAGGCCAAVVVACGRVTGRVALGIWAVVGWERKRRVRIAMRRK
ncbi:hypothetical protein HDV00_003743 [Rhizophlyctis rosea]|nr:hypothetical protein HDV00_003743 [Rhizophlyctis rosea]